MRYGIVLLFSIWMLGCSEPKDNQGFTEWYGERFNKPAYVAGSGLPDPNVFEFSSELFTIDTIYRSMAGPYAKDTIALVSEDSLLWIVGYDVEILDDSIDGSREEFLCHSNLNFTSGYNAPWSSTNNLFNQRIFTLSQGISSVWMPKGFGIPVYGLQQFEIFSQVLNHNLYPVEQSVRHRVRIHYYAESQLTYKLTPLQQRTIFAFKQFVGPEGQFGTKGSDGHDLRQPSCGVDEVIMGNEKDSFNIFWDPQGRKFTGHWKVPPGAEDIEMEISQLMGLQKKTKVYTIFCHVHPYCEKLEFKDLQTGDLIFSASIRSEDSLVGLVDIPKYVSEDGYVLYPNRKYSIRSVYNNASKHTLSAMSVMLLYTEMD